MRNVFPEKGVLTGETPDELHGVVARIKAGPTENYWDYSNKYIMLKVLSTVLHWKTSEQKVEQFRLEARKKVANVARVDVGITEAEALAGFDRIWPRLSELVKSPASYYAMKKFCMESVFMYPYFVELAGKAVALEASHGYSVDLAGHYRKIPPTDGMYRLCALEPTFRSFLDRYWYAQQKILEMKQKYAAKLHVLVLGGGMIPQFSTFELSLQQSVELFEIVVYDKDPDVPLLFKEKYGKSFEDYGIEFHNTDFREILDYGEPASFDIVLAQGIFSYFTAEERSRLVPQVSRLLPPQGLMIFDLQIMEPSMIRCVIMAPNWATVGLKPEKSLKVATEHVQTLVDENDDLELLDWQPDIYNDKPAIANYVLIKK